MKLPKEIQNILEKYEVLRNKDFVYSDMLWSIIARNLSLRMLKKLTIKELYRKINRLFVMLFNARKTKDKVIYYLNPKIGINSIKRPEWQENRKRSFNKKRNYTHS